MDTIEFDGIACYNVEINLGKSPLSGQSKILILETNSQPDYYSRANFPPNKHQGNWRLFLLVKKHIDCFQDIVLKKAYQINQKLSEKSEIMPGQMSVGSKTQQCIRINLTGTENLEIIIKELQSLGIEFVSDKKMAPFTSKVFFKRYTEFVKMEDGVYHDSKIKGRYFFEINNNIELDTFNEGIKKIKHNCDFHLFDTFLSFIFIKGKGQDFIGIYSEHCDEARFGELKKFIKLTFEV